MDPRTSQLASTGWWRSATEIGDRIVGETLIRTLERAQLVKVRVAAVTSLLAVLAALATLAVAWNIFDTTLRMVTITSTLLFLAVIPLLRLLAHKPELALTLANNCVPAGLVLSCAFACVYSAGQLPFATMYAPAIPLLSMMTCSIRASLFWSGLMAGALVVGMLMPSNFQPPALPLWLPLAGSLTVLIPTFISMLLHRRIWERALEREKAARTQLDRRYEEQRLLDLKLSEHDRAESLSLMAGRLAHDLNGFLTSIIGHTDLAQSTLRDGNPAATEQHLNAVDTASEHARELASQMLNYTGRGHQTLVSVEMSERLATAVVLAQSTIPKGSRIHVHANDTVSVQGDPTQLDQVIVNLIRNAAESYGEGIGQVDVELACNNVTEAFTSDSDGTVLPPGKYACLTVSDQGSGIPPPLTDKLFDPFTTSKPKGRGLGLASVAGIIKAMGGGITVQKHSDRGSQFCVWLPAARTAKATRTSGNNLPEEPPDKGRSACRILVADDEPAVREVLAALLGRMNAKVDFACDGMQVLDRLGTEQTAMSAVVMDVSMPNLDGLATLTELRAHHASLPVVLVTGYATSATSALQRDDRFLKILQKPFNADALHRALISLGVPVAQIQR